jgi:integrase
MKSYEVRFWSIRRGQAKKHPSYQVRWKVGPEPQSRTMVRKALAENFLNELRKAASNGEAFDTETGLPDSMTEQPEPVRPDDAWEPTWLEHCLAYTDMKWPGAAPKTRDSLTDALSVIIPAATSEPAPDGIGTATLRRALRHYAMEPGSRTRERPGEIAAALDWLAEASLPVSELGEPARARPVLDAIAVLNDGTTAAANTIARKRAVFTGALQYAIELGHIPSSPLGRLTWTPPKTDDVVDPRRVVNPRQARELLIAVTYVGLQRRARGDGHRYSRGQRLMALYACMYYAGLRPGEAVALKLRNCYLPETGWGRITLEKSRPEVNRRWTSTGRAHDERQLKHRPLKTTRPIPIPPELVAILRTHIATFGTASDGRLFSSQRGHVVASTAISDTWSAARHLALTPEQTDSPLADHPYALRHACVSFWLNAGLSRQVVAERAGHSVAVLLRVYAKCLDDGDDAANARIQAALEEALAPDPPPAQHDEPELP